MVCHSLGGGRGGRGGGVVGKYPLGVSGGIYSSIPSRAPSQAFYIDFDIFFVCTVCLIC